MRESVRRTSHSDGFDRIQHIHFIIGANIRRYDVLARRCVIVVEVEDGWILEVDTNHVVPLTLD